MLRLRVRFLENFDYLSGEIPVGGLDLQERGAPAHIQSRVVVRRRRRLRTNHANGAQAATVESCGDFRVSGEA